jgi:apolipoprotein D and lipocalin family protein
MKAMRVGFLLFPLVLLSACVEPPVNRTSGQPLQVEQVDLDRYLGRWHEAARLPNNFEERCVAATADYSRREDELIAVRNVCTEADGSTRDAVGRARPIGLPGEGKLEVSFFGPFWGDYWVLDLAPDYSWSIVGEPEGRYLWILTREETLSPALKEDLRARAAALGYQTDLLIWNEGVAG